MKPIAVSIIILSILLSSLIVLTPFEIIANGKLSNGAKIQIADACCQGKRGNVNGAGIIDLADLSALVSYLTGGGYAFTCPGAANVNGAGIIDLGDLSALVSYLTGGGYVLPDCPAPPILTTTSISAITLTTAQSGGTITSDGGATVTVRGVCWSVNPMPSFVDDTTSDGTGMGIYTSSITGLTAGTQYFVRAYATNSAGTGYGNEVSFTSASAPSTVTDIDGNVYQTVIIGSQVWMAENLKVTHYRNGDALPNVTDGTTWSGLSTGACCVYNNDENNVVTYGRLYNGYASIDSRNIAPAGWHVPSNAELQTLIDFLGGSSVASGKLKETGTTHWNSPNTGATNESMFTALPGGYRSSNGNFYNVGYEAGFWSSTEGGGFSAWIRILYFDNLQIFAGFDDKKNGYSVRCVRD